VQRNQDAKQPDLQSGWVGVVDNKDGYHHVMPVNDWIEHEFDDCICVPEVEPIECDDGSLAYLISHASLDGREHYE
jgi:hypothetical protein